MPDQELKDYTLFKKQLEKKIEEKAKEILDEFFFGDISKIKQGGVGD